MQHAIKTLMVRNFRAASVEKFSTLPEPQVGAQNQRWTNQNTENAKADRKKKCDTMSCPLGSLSNDSALDQFSIPSRTHEEGPEAMVDRKNTQKHTMHLEVEAKKKA